MSATQGRADQAPTYDDLPGPAQGWLRSGAAAPVWRPYFTATWRIDRPAGATCYLKAGWLGRYPSLDAEHARMLWLADRGAPVPTVLDSGSNGRVEWFVTRALPGTPATDGALLAEPRRTVPILALGLRSFHEIDPTDCPFDHRLAATLAHVEERVRRAEIERAGFHEVHRHLTPARALALLRASRLPEVDLVLTHGDYCFPNATIAAGAVVGVLDVGESGVADRWRDLAVATWSVTWNVGPGYEDLFLQAYGVEWDPERRDLYRLAYDLES